MEEVIMNSRGDIAVIRSKVVGFDISEAIPGNSPAMLMILTYAGTGRPNEIPFEVASTDEELKPLVERFRELFENGGTGITSQYTGEYLNEQICRAFGINPEAVFSATIELKVGEVARVRTYGFVETSDGKIDKLKKIFKEYELKPKGGYQ